MSATLILHEPYLAAKHRLEWLIPDMTLLGEFTVSDMEMRSSMTNERAFLCVIEARMASTLAEMAALLVAPTFPVHDLPGAA